MDRKASIKRVSPKVTIAPHTVIHAYAKMISIKVFMLSPP